MSRTVPLMLQLSAADPRPISRQIIDAIRLQIASGELPVGAQLPSVRGLAKQLTVNPNTIAKAYSELSNQGWLDSRQGLGLFVAAPRQQLSDDERERRLGIAIDSFVAEVVGLNYTKREILDRMDAELKPVLGQTHSKRRA
ncbi:GntR family transcriptional regulator [Microbulbifer sp. CAU 1566]|uniref:GntR family transcriptional regulator n=1 Tax=Microbulbifer sp. CAU 1566 TaxID=2933269 RepID=UPI002002C85C|nr:GntR family transcriptional regulator [Microbulbifer sp. CAU 1566]MCK7598336.1 GntR family transcriptional regulator [Microbulbifer sp. CAU 1566]